VEPPFRLELNSEVYKTPASPCMLWRRLNDYNIFI